MRQPKLAGDGIFVAIVITTCTNRKRKPVHDCLRASSIPRAKLADLAASWSERLKLPHSLFPALEIYCGRAFQEAAAAATHLNARLLIVSAGLGMVDDSQRVPPYACTVLPGAPDSMASRAADTFTPGAWWREVTQVSPFATPLRDVLLRTTGLICAALSEAYIDMVTEDFISLPPSELERLRVFTRTPIARIAPALRRFVMPYDDRLDGPDSSIPGTRSDFAGRALRHFAQHVADCGQLNRAEADAAAVQSILEGWQMPRPLNRTRHDDETIRNLIATHWHATNGSSARLLRLFRDELNIACEQGRFAGLVRDVRASSA